jgi:hypothetical protein
MSTTEGGGNIVNDGLILYLDGANPRSLVSGSTIWYDMSKLSKTPLMINNPTFTTERGGGLLFDGTNDYVTLGTDQDYYFNLTKPFTLSVWFKANTLKNCGIINRFNAGVRGNYFFKLLVTGNLMFVRETTSNFFSNQLLTTNVIYNVVFTYDGINRRIYINNNLDNTLSSGNIVANQSNVNLFIGSSQAFNNPTEFFDGIIYNTSIYNKSLTEQEISQNYNTLKSRFGL